MKKTCLLNKEAFFLMYALVVALTQSDISNSWPHPNILMVKIDYSEDGI